MNCLNCKKETTNPKYCSKSCAAIVNGRQHKKRKLTRICRIAGCNNLTTSWRASTCDKHKHYPKYKRRLDVKKSNAVIGKHPSWNSAYIRQQNRIQNKEMLKLPCNKCGYDKHVELCHIKPVSSFDDDSLISEINAKENVIQLCRNCHWEMDHTLSC